MKISILTFSSVLMKICQIAHPIFQTTSQFFFKFYMTRQCLEIYSSVIFLGQMLYTLHRGTNQSANFLGFLVLGSKFSKFLSFLKQKISFSSNFVPLFGIMRHNSSMLFQLKLYILSAKVAYQSTNLVKFHLSSRKSEILHFGGKNN